ncbi:PLCD [Mytilus coruscus]|uniref:PLCD n=1 Tax=Mytilus coruscus TaxID=42192 RepID=A0A6J8F0F5_MYTCO|nr:PLCD [Mytilus coruscus]
MKKQLLSMLAKDYTKKHAQLQEMIPGLTVYSTSIDQACLYASVHGEEPQQHKTFYLKHSLSAFRVLAIATSLLLLTFKTAADAQPMALCEKFLFLGSPEVQDNLEKIEQDLHLYKRYIKTDFKPHTSLADQCPDHCIMFALSDPTDPTFQKKCTHSHNMVCDRSYLSSDNTGCYHCGNTWLSLNGISQRTGIMIKRYDFSEAQDGKSNCDAKIANLKSKIRLYVSSGNDVKTAGDMKNAIDALGCVMGYQAAHVQISSEVAAEATKIKNTWKGITKISKIELRYDGGKGYFIADDHLRLMKEQQKKYLSVLPSDLRMYLCKFQCLSNKLPIGTGRFFNINRTKRHCNLCNANELGKRLATVGNAVSENKEQHEVSDEDEAAEVQNSTSQEKEWAQKIKTKWKLSSKFSAIVGMKAVSYKGIEETLPTGENKMLKIIEHDPEGLNKLTQELFVRTYPAGSSTDSSNYNLTPMWNVGCQVGEIIDPFVKIEVHGLKSDQQSVKTSVKDNNGMSQIVCQYVTDSMSEYHRKYVSMSQIVCQYITDM